jgi:hypothetical protein
MFPITPLITDAWPPFTPHLNLLDFYLCGHLKILVCVAPVDSEEALHNGIVDACQTICNYPGNVGCGGP